MRKGVKEGLKTSIQDKRDVMEQTSPVHASPTPPEVTGLDVLGPCSDCGESIKNTPGAKRAWDKASLSNYPHRCFNCNNAFFEKRKASLAR